MKPSIITLAIILIAAFANAQPAPVKVDEVKVLDACLDGGGLQKISYLPNT